MKKKAKTSKKSVTTESTLPVKTKVKKLDLPKKLIELEFKVDDRFSHKENFMPALQKAAKKSIDDLHKNHFNPTKKMGWDINYSMVVADVFYDAFGHHLENYVLVELAKKKCYSLCSSDKPAGGLVIRRTGKRTK